MSWDLLSSGSEERGQRLPHTHPSEDTLLPTEGVQGGMKHPRENIEPMGVRGSLGGTRVPMDWAKKPLSHLQDGRSPSTWGPLGSHWEEQRIRGRHPGGTGRMSGQDHSHGTSWCRQPGRGAWKLPGCPEPAPHTHTPAPFPPRHPFCSSKWDKPKSELAAGICLCLCPCLTVSFSLFLCLSVSVSLFTVSVSLTHLHQAQPPLAWTAACRKGVGG